MAAKKTTSWVDVVGGIPVWIILGCIVAGIGSYMLTDHRVKNLEQTVSAIQAKQDSVGPMVQNNVREEAARREALGKEFLANMSKQSEILGKMDTRLAVSEKQQEQAQSYLKEIATELK